jgi:hypothetical protein
MKKSILIVLTLLVFKSIFAQTEKENFKIISTKMINYFNKGDNKNIVAMFSKGMNKALPIDKFTKFTSGLKSDFGNIKRVSFFRLKRLAGVETAMYKAFFEKGILEMDITLNENDEIDALYFKPYSEAKEIIRNTTKMKLPFKDEWTLTWGGDTKELNYHVESIAQKNAFDILILDKKGSSYKGNGEKNEDYYAFGKELYAPCDGEVVLVVDGVKDNVPGVLNPIYNPGNSVIIKTATGEYAFFAHFKQYTIEVKEGQKVKTGDYLGLCGNSGNSSEPHLHFHLQNIEDMNTAIGTKCYFEKIKVNGIIKSDYSPIKGEKVQVVN